MGGMLHVKIGCNWSSKSAYHLAYVEAANKPEKQMVFSESKWFSDANQDSQTS